MFEDPTMGFEARDTDLSNRINTWRLLIESTSWNGELSLYPRFYNDSDKSFKNETKKIVMKKRNRKSKKKFSTNYIQQNPFESKNHHSDSMFCGKIIEDYVHFVIETNDGSNLLELNSIKNICKLDKFLLRMEYSNLTNSKSNSNASLFSDYCEVKNFDDCCPSWSISNYILLHANKSNCDLLTENDVDQFVNLLHFCSPFYAEHYLNEDCSSNDPSACPNTPERCIAYENLVFNVFHYLVDYDFLNIKEKIIFFQKEIEQTSYNNESTVFEKKPFLTSASIFLPIAKSSKLMLYFETINRNSKSFLKNDLLLLNSKHDHLSYGNIHVVAADLGLKYTLFNKSVITDLVLPSTAGLIILFSLLIFTRSIILTVMTLLTNLASLSSAYFIYTYILNINFFPFLNLLSVIILVAIGSDNALIYCKAWTCVSSNYRTTLNRGKHYENELSSTFNHVLMSSFCASFTTCGAFFAGYFSNITSLKCFSIFSGLSIITNFFITTITFPSAIIISDYFRNESSLTLYCKTKSNRKDCFQYVFDKIILKIVFNYHYFLVILLSLISFLSIFIVFCLPGLRLPISQDFQIFNSEHLFERYDLEYRNKFWFSHIDKIKDNKQSSFSEDDKHMYASKQSNFVLPIRIVFGILPQDNGNFLDPFDRGKLQFDPVFNISSQRSQIWLLEFCREIRAQTFYKSTLGPLLTNCFIETLQTWMEKRKCTEIIGNDVLDHYPCCELSKFPYEPKTFNFCLAELIDRLHRTPNFIFNTNQAGPRFNLSSGLLKAFVIEYDTIYGGISTSFVKTDHIWNKLNQWVNGRLEMAPKELKSGWFITSNMEFYTLQSSLSTGVVKSLFISVLFAFITLIFTTMHIRLSIISIITISFIIFSSIASLILLGWRLNIIESIVISLTIGLSIDATLHYTIAYKMLTKSTGNRLLGVQMTVARIGSPVAMGAITTFIAGTIMLFSNVLAYIQIGTFLMVISFFSFTYSTLFHLSLLIIFGSQQDQINIKKCFDFNFIKFFNLINIRTKVNDNSNNNNNNNNISYPPELFNITRSSTNSIYLRVTSI